MKVAVLGANGFMGRHILRRHPEWVGVSRDVLNLVDQEQVESFFEKNKFDIVVHCAVEGGSMLKKENGDITHNNILMFENVNRVFKGKMLYFSSGAGTQGNPPVSPYGLSKWIIDQRIKTLPNAYTLRVFGCYGEGDGSSKYRDRFKSICKSEGHIVIDKDRYFDMVDIEDVMDVIDDYVGDNRHDKEIDLVYPKAKKLSEWAVEFGATYEIKDESGLDVPYISNGPRDTFI